MFSKTVSNNISLQLILVIWTYRTLATASCLLLEVQQPYWPSNYLANTHTSYLASDPRIHVLLKFLITTWRMKSHSQKKLSANYHYHPLRLIWLKCIKQCCFSRRSRAFWIRFIVQSVFIINSCSELMISSCVTPPRLKPTCEITKHSTSLYYCDNEYTNRAEVACI